jgi:hypothetical protein
LATNWDDIKRLNSEENQRIHQKKMAVSIILQDAIESLMDIFLIEKNWANAAAPLQQIETVWRVLGPRVGSR